MNKQTFKIGDRVTVRAGCGGDYSHEGQDGTIIKLALTACPSNFWLVEHSDGYRCTYPDYVLDPVPAEPSPIEHTLTHEWSSREALARLTWSGDNDSLPVLDLDDGCMTREQLVALRDLLAAALEVINK